MSAMLRQFQGNARGVILFALGVFFMSALDAVAKMLAQTYSELQVIFFESVFGLLFFFGIIAPSTWRSMVSPRWPLMIGRGLLTLGTMYFFIAGLKVLPLAEVTIIFMVSPIISMCLSSLFFREHASVLQVLAVVAGALGACLIIRPPGVGMNMAALLPLAAAFCSAFGLAAARALSRRDTPEAITGYEYLTIFLVAVLLVPAGDHLPETPDLWLVVLLGLFGALCVYCRTKACSVSPLSLMAPVEYSGMIWAIIFGYAIWNNLPDFWGWVGAGLIAIGGLLPALPIGQSARKENRL